jgi:hypothetical protein
MVSVILSKIFSRTYFSRKVLPEDVLTLKAILKFTFCNACDDEFAVRVFKTHLSLMMISLWM